MFVGLSFACHSLVYQTLIQFTPLITQSFAGISPTEGALTTGFLLNEFFWQFDCRAGIAARSPTSAYHTVYFLNCTAVVGCHNLIQWPVTVAVSSVKPSWAIHRWFSPNFSISLVDQIRTQNLPVLWHGLSNSGFGMLIGPALVGWIVDVTQNWSLGILCLIPACLAVIGMSGRLVLADPHS